MSNPFKAIKKAVKGIVKFVTKTVTSIVNFIGDIVGFVFNPMGAFDVPQPTTAQPDQEAQGITITKQGTNQAIPIVYGFRRVGGSLIYLETNGSNNKYLYAVYTVAEGEILGFKRILVEDVELPLPKTNGSLLGVAGSFTQQIYDPNVIYTVKSGRFADRIKFQVYNGTETQPQSGLANEAPNWSQRSRKLPGVAYAVIRFEWKEIKTQDDANNNPFNGGIPKVQFDIVGRKVYDIRLHSTGAQLSATYANLPKSYQINPASCLLDYLLDPRAGCGLSIDEINAETFKIAANKFDQQVTYYTGQVGRAMTLNAVLDTNARLFDNVKQLVSGCRGFLPYVQGRYKLKVEDGGHPTDISSTTVTSAFDVTKDYIIGGITLDGERKNSKFNEVVVNYVDPDLDFTNQQVFYSVNGDQAADNNELLRREFNFPTLTNRSIAQDIALLIYKKSRVGRAITFQGTQELQNLEVGDIIRVTDSVLNLSNDTFRIVDLKLNLDLSVDISAVEHDATVYPFTTGAQVELPAPLFLPSELTIGPRVKPVSSPPLGIQPPNDPDEDSAGALINPLPDPDDPVETRVVNFTSTFTANDSRYISRVLTSANNANITDDSVVYDSGSQFFEIANNRGLAFGSNDLGQQTATRQSYYGVDALAETSMIANQYIHRRYVANFLYTGTYDPVVAFSVRINQPSNTAFKYVRLRGYTRNGTEVASHLQTIEIQPLKNILIKDHTFNRQFGDKGDKIDYLKWSWLKRTTTGFEEVADGSDLGAFYTYYDAFEGKNKTEKTINAFINYALQNPEVAVFDIPVGTQTSGASSVKTSHNLGA